MTYRMNHLPRMNVVEKKWKIKLTGNKIEVTKLQSTWSIVLFEIWIEK